MQGSSSSEASALINFCDNTVFKPSAENNPAIKESWRNKGSSLADSVKRSMRSLGSSRKAMRGFTVSAPEYKPANDGCRGRVTMPPPRVHPGRASPDTTELVRPSGPNTGLESTQIHATE